MALNKKGIPFTAVDRHRSCARKEHRALHSKGEIRIALANQAITATSFFLKPEVHFEIFSDISEARAYLLLS